MPKMKTHSGAKKRFRLRANGSVKSEGTRKTTPHKMSNRQRRSARMGSAITGKTASNLKRMLVKA